VPFGHYMQSLAPDELVSKKSGSIGWGIGATLGTKLAHPAGRFSERSATVA
jgi:thiamine pyrophosphate-dependent acetolactate synthase large subunit-like protein